MLTTLLLGLSLLAPAALADDDSDEVTESTVSGKRPPELDESSLLESGVPAGNHVMDDDRFYSERVYRGAKILKTSEEFVKGCVDGVEALYHRDYKAAQASFQGVDRKYPGQGVYHVGQVLIWQALMLENFDFKYVSQYETHWKQARMELEQALYQPGNEAWEYFILGGILGIDSIHTMRTGEYVKALNRGIEAMKSVNKSKEYAPDFKDAFLGDGLFNYWRTVIAMNSKAIPDMGDKRAEGIRQMQEVEREGIFLGPPATLALVFTWMEEGKWQRALDDTLKNQAKYPENVVNNLVLGRVYMYMKKYPESERALMGVIAQDAKNERVHYYLCRLYLRTRDYDKAEKSIDKYLAFDLGDEHAAYAWYQKGMVAYRQKRWDDAEKAFKQSWKTGRLEQAKRRIELVEKKKAEAAG
ncbi:MAG: tetratricopeptide repeat protein [Alphaproteobacteria bacterium]|nr:tetratricopeptide repeat protein [Alphaproteobacteria bacterium]